MNQTPLQKSIAEIEAKIAEVRKRNTGASSDEIQRTELLIAGLCSAKSTLTANLEYEREEIKDAYQQGHDDACDGNAGQRKEFTSGNDYYTKTYEHERKD